MLSIAFSITLACIAAPALALGQTAFEVATVKIAPPQPPGRTSSGFSVNDTRGRLSYANVTLRDLISRAYRVARFQIAGPDQLDSDRFDLEATFTPGTPIDRVPVMLEALLKERFHVALHRESRDMPVYSLTVAKGGSKMKALTTDDNDINSNSSRTSWHVSAKAGMKGLAEFLAERVQRPVLDETGLTGAFEMTLDWTPEDAAPANDSATTISLFTALQEQLGLKLAATRGSAEMIVVDRADRAPTEN